MAFARDVFTATAAQTNFTISFPYQKEVDVLVYNAGVLKTVGASNDYIFLNSTTIQFNSGVTENNIVILQRATSHAVRTVNYTAGALSEADLDNDSIQAFYMAQESVDITATALKKGTNEKWDATTLQINNVVDPSVNQDAATKKYVDTGDAGTVTSAAAAASSASAAATSETGAATSATSAATSATGAATSATGAATSATSSATSATASQASVDVLGDPVTVDKGGTNAATAALARISLDVERGHWVHVKDHGAVGNGSTDDRTAIQAAMDAANSAGGGTVWFPAGTYMVNTRLNAKSNVVLQGVFRKTIIKAGSASDQEVMINPDASSDIEVENFGFIGMVFDGNKANQPTNTAARSAVDISGVKNFFAKDCSFQNAQGYGLGLQARPDTQAGGWSEGAQEDIYLENCVFDNNGDGGDNGDFDGLDIKNCLRLTLVNCVAKNNKLDGFDVRGTAIAFIGCKAFDNGEDGFQIKANANDEAIEGQVDIIGCWSFSNDRDGIFLAPGGAGSETKIVELTVNASRCYNNTRDGLHFNGGTDNRTSLNVSGLYSKGNTGHGIALAESAPRIILLNNIVCENNGGDGINSVVVRNLTVTGGLLANNTGWGFNETGTGVKARLFGIQFSGNSSGAVNASAGLYAEGCFGFKTTNTAISANVAIDSTGEKSFNIAHGLSITPLKQDCHLQGNRETVVNDYLINHLVVAAVDATNCICRMMVGTASGTGSSVIKVSLTVNARPSAV